MTYTANPCADEAAEVAEAKRLSDAFVSAAEWGPDEPLERFDMREALYELTSCHENGCDLIEAFFYYAATKTGDPVLRAMVREAADAWAEFKQAEAA